MKFVHRVVRTLRAIEQIQQGGELGHRGFHAGRIREWQGHVAPRQVQPATPQVLAQVVFSAQVTNRSQVDAVVAVTLHRIEDADRVGDVGVDADRDFKGAEGDGSAGDGDRFAQVGRHATD